ncbi:MAG: HAD family hydrolase [Candidatus Firestonebacteria bacterium]
MNPPKLVVFDVDNTLTFTGKVDTECFLGTLAEKFGFKNINSDWSRYKNVTAASILDQIFVEQTGKHPKRKELQAMADGFLENIRKKAASNPEMFLEVPGAREMMTELLKLKDFAVAIATGSFSASSAYKLEVAQVPFDSAVLASGFDCLTREELLDGAVQKAKAKYGVSNFSAIVSVGDGLWDLKAAEATGIPFIGVGNKKQLDEYSVEHWVENFLDKDEFFELLKKLS